MNEASAQVWENIHPSLPLIRKMAFQVVSHTARQQIAPSLTSAPGPTEVRDGGGCDTEKT